MGSEDASLLERVENAEKQRQQAALLSLMPPNVVKRAADVETRFKADWLFIKGEWVSPRPS